ncbi:MAG: cell wall-associated protein wapA, partial [Bdellovibrionales bacterium]|nr:cell wall-associated protein wapA [Bdellovibrionales bacterium]
FETSLKITAKNKLRIIYCGDGFELDYTPAKYDGKDLDKNISLIMTEVKKRNKGKDNRYFTNLENDIRTDSALREEFAKQLNITGSVSKNTKYLANGRSNDFVTYDGATYVRTLPNGTYQKFSKNGQLIQMSDRNGNFIKIAYNGDKILTVTDNAGTSLQFKYYNNSKYVKQVVGPRGLSATYKYKGENLVSINNAWKNTYTHEYDDLYNMTKATYPDKTFIALTYDKDKDWVTSFKDRRSCKESYTYSSDEKDPLNNYSSEVVKVCGGKVTNKSSYSFWHKTKKDGSRYLARSKAVINGQTVDTTYHEEFGKPTEIVRDDVTSRFGYYSNGLLKTKIDPNHAYNYKYDNNCAKVSLLTVVITPPPAVADTKGSKDRKPTKEATQTLKTAFSYDSKRCNLVAAKSSTGQTVSLAYDMKGRIARITDQSKKIVTITYDERFGKPAVVSRPGLGTIKFKYKPDGTMDKFDSQDEPLVAIQVANIFSNLLEIIAPATTESNNI